MVGIVGNHEEAEELLDDGGEGIQIIEGDDEDGTVDLGEEF